MSLINSFKNFRRKRVSRNEKKPATTSPKASTAEKTKSPGISGLLNKPSIPPGEDRVSFERHRKALRIEYSKKDHGNKQVVADLMDRTFAFRRADILEHNYDLQDVFNNYPFLQKNNEVL